MGVIFFTSDDLAGITVAKELFCIEPLIVGWLFLVAELFTEVAPRVFLYPADDLIFFVSEFFAIVSYTIDTK